MYYSVFVLNFGGDVVLWYVLFGVVIWFFVWLCFLLVNGCVFLFE